VEGDITAQTTRVLDNVKAVLAGNSMTFAHVVKATVFLAEEQIPNGDSLRVRPDCSGRV